MICMRRPDVVVGSFSAGRGDGHMSMFVYVMVSDGIRSEPGGASAEERRRSGCAGA